MAAESAVHVTVVVSPAARQVREVLLTLPGGATVAQALAASGLLADGTQSPSQENAGPPQVFLHPLGGPAAKWQGWGRSDELSLTVWGRKAAPGQVLRDQDRVELCRALQVDPKVARRLRFVKQGARSAGLFARKRPGAKAGY